MVMEEKIEVPLGPMILKFIKKVIQEVIVVKKVEVRAIITEGFKMYK